MTFEVNKNNIDVEGFSNGLKMTTINLLSNPQNKVLPPQINQILEQKNYLLWITIS